MSAPYFAEYKARYPTVHQAVEAVAKETEKIGFTKAEMHRQCIELLRRHWMEFCKLNLPYNSYGPPPHTPIAASTIRRVIERDKTDTKDNVLALLRESGL